MSCIFQHSIAELEVPGEACGLQIPHKALWFGRGEAVLCGNNLSFSFLLLLLVELPLTLLSAAAWIWQQAFGPDLKCGLFIPGGGDPPSPGRSPAGLSDPCCLLMGQCVGELPPLLFLTCNFVVSL